MDSLIIFVKYPKSGFVKTRLAKDIGKDRATLFYRQIAKEIIKRTYSVRYKQLVFYTPRNKEKEIFSWLGNNLECYPQEGEDLGQRLYNAFKISFEKGAKKSVVIGTDSPLLDENIILEAFEELKRKECVIGPSLDGGYYLLGLRALHKELFAGIEWGTSKVLAASKDKFSNLGLSFSLLAENFDIDNKDNLYLFAEKLKSCFADKELAQILERAIRK